MVFFAENQLGTVITDETPMEVNTENTLKVDPKLKQEKQNQINFKSKKEAEKKEINDDLYSNDDESMPCEVICLKENNSVDNEKGDEPKTKNQVKTLNFEKKPDTDAGKKRIKLVPL